MFGLCLQDKARHMAYGMAMLKLTVAVKGVDFGVSLRRILGSIEKDMAGELRDPVLWEAMAIISGGSVGRMSEGKAAVDRLRSDYIREYLGPIAVRRHQQAGKRVASGPGGRIAVTPAGLPAAKKTSRAGAKPALFWWAMA